VKKTKNQTDGQYFYAAGKLWRTFAPGLRVWQWFGWIVRRFQRIPTRSHRLQFPEGVVTVRAEQVNEMPAKVSKLARQAPLRGPK